MIPSVIRFLWRFDALNTLSMIFFRQFTLILRLFVLLLWISRNKISHCRCFKRLYVNKLFESPKVIVFYESLRHAIIVTAFLSQGKSWIILQFDDFSFAKISFCTSLTLSTSEQKFDTAFFYFCKCLANMYSVVE